MPIHGNHISSHLVLVINSIGHILQNRYDIIDLTIRFFRQKSFFKYFSDKTKWYVYILAAAYQIGGLYKIFSLY